MRLTMLSIFSVALLLASCVGGSQQVTLEINLEHNGVPFEVGETLYKGDTAIKFELIHFYLSQIALGDQVMEPVVFINAQDSASMHYVLPLTKKVEQFSFGMGVDSINNIQDPTSFGPDHPLSSSNSMYWSWATMYRFFKIDGRVNATGALGTDDQLLAWHTGKNALYRTKEINVSIKPGAHLVLTFDLAELYSGVSLDTETMTHSMVDDYTIAVKLSDNLPAAFSLRVQ
ncbi:MAG: hypothetical protein O2862_00835 [Bacteroidetes bacterium]|nr:hypothetical protein [Bacteroidota bacterium]